MVYLQTKKFVTHSTFTSSPGGSSFNVYCLTRLVVPRQGLPLDQVICPFDMYHQSRRSVPQCLPPDQACPATFSCNPGLSLQVYLQTRLSVPLHVPLIQEVCLTLSTSKPSHSTSTYSPGGSSFDVYFLTRLLSLDMYHQFKRSVPQGLPPDQDVCPTFSSNPGGLSFQVYLQTRLSVPQHLTLIRKVCHPMSTS